MESVDLFDSKRYLQDVVYNLALAVAEGNLELAYLSDLSDHLFVLYEQHTKWSKRKPIANGNWVRDWQSKLVDNSEFDSSVFNMAVPYKVAGPYYLEIVANLKSERISFIDVGCLARVLKNFVDKRKSDKWTTLAACLGGKDRVKVLQEKFMGKVASVSSQ